MFKLHPAKKRGGTPGDTQDLCVTARAVAKHTCLVYPTQELGLAAGDFGSRAQPCWWLPLYSALGFASWKEVSLPQLLWGNRQGRRGGEWALGEPPNNLPWSPNHHRHRMVKSMTFGVRQTWVQIPALQFLNCFGPQIPHL